MYILVIYKVFVVGFVLGFVYLGEINIVLFVFRMVKFCIKVLVGVVVIVDC